MKINISFSYIALLFFIVVGVDPIRDEYLTGEGVSFGSILSGSSIYIAASASVFFIIYRNTYKANRSEIFIGFIISISACLAYYLLTILWSSNPVAGAKKLLLISVVTFSTILILYKTSRFITYLSLLDFIGICTALSVVTSMLFQGAVHSATVFDPELEGAWKGILGHKNHAGLAGGLLLLMLPAFFRTNPYRFTIYFLLSILLIVMSKAKTILPFVAISYIITFSATYVSGNGSRSSVVKTSGLLFLALLLTGLVVLSDQLALLLSDPSALTGRPAIWELLVEASQDKLVFGYGFGGVFDPNFPIVLETYTRDWRAYIYHAHNGYLEIILSGGIIGLFLWLFIGMLIPFIILGRTTSNQIDRFTPISVRLFIFLALYNLMETSFLNERSLGWTAWSVLLAMACVHERR